MIDMSKSCVVVTDLFKAIFYENFVFWYEKTIFMTVKKQFLVYLDESLDCNVYCCFDWAANAWAASVLD